MGVHRLHDGAEFIAVRQPVGDDDHFSPSRAGTARIDHPPGSSRVNGIAQIGVPSADAVQVVSEMALDAKGAGIVGEGTVLGAHGHVKAGGEGQCGHFERCEPYECRIERTWLCSGRVPEPQPEHADHQRREGKEQQDAHESGH